MVHFVEHSDWIFEHSLVHDAHFPSLAETPAPSSDPTSNAALHGSLQSLWHQSDMSGATHLDPALATSLVALLHPSAAPKVTVGTHALTVTEGGSVGLPISVSPSHQGDAVSVTIKGLASYETVTDNFDHKVFAGSSVTLSADEVKSGLTLASSYSGPGHPVNTIAVTAAETVGDHAVTSAAQTIAVTDPPASSNAGTASSATRPGSNPLTLVVAGDNMNGTDPEFQVFVDGKQVGGTHTVTADHTQGQTQTVQVAGNFDPTVAHQVQVKFINDAWDGTPWWSNGTAPDGHDVNLYVESISLNGTTIAGVKGTNTADNGVIHPANANEAVMATDGTLSFSVAKDPPAPAPAPTPTPAPAPTPSASNPLTLVVAGDNMNGTDPEFQVFVDGKQVGGTYTVTADHTQGQTQTVQVAGNFDPTVAHQVQVKFINDAWDGTSWWSNGTAPDGHDVNLYVESISLNGTTIAGVKGTNTADNGVIHPANANEAVMATDGTLSFSVADPPASPAVVAGGGGSSSGSSSSSGGMSPSAGAGPVPSGPGFFVSPNGNDSNPGTLAAPFATLERAQQAMENSSIKTTYIEGGTYHLSSPISLGAADSGETWTYYPADGADTAVLDGGTSATGAFMINGAPNVTIDGLKMQNFTQWTIEAYTSPGTVIENNDIGFMTVAPPVEDAAAVVGVTVGDHVTVQNNYLHDLAGAGIATFAFSAGQSDDGTVISGNVVVRADQRSSDDGAIYVNMSGTGDSGGHVTIKNNFVADIGGAGFNNLRDIYLDDNSSNVTVTGNVLGPLASGVASNGGNFQAIMVHNGNDDTISGNIIDLGSSSFENVATWGYDSASLAGMANNTFTNNIVLSDFTGANHADSGFGNYAYLEGGPNASASWVRVANNVYWNVASGGQVYFNGDHTNDTNPIVENPHLSAASFAVANASVNFTPIIGGWGPPGYVMPSGMLPSV